MLSAGFMDSMDSMDAEFGLLELELGVDLGSDLDSGSDLDLN